MPRADLTDIIFVLDRSSSMHCIREATIRSFNQFLQTQKEATGVAVMTLIQFSYESEILFEGLPIEQVPDLDQHNYVLHRGTALLDAMGQAMIQRGQALAALPEAERPGTVLFVTLTDGYEHSSQQFDIPRIHAMVTRQQEVYNWQFLFLGANQDSIHTASSLGIGASQALTYDSTDPGICSLLNLLGEKLSVMRAQIAEGKPCSPVEFNATDRDSVIDPNRVQHRRP